MKQALSIAKAINKGHIMVNLPVFLIMVGFPSLLHLLGLDKKIVLVAAIIGVIMAWFIWSIVITKWKIWAFERIENIEELKRRAIDEKLIWPDGHIFERTEIRSKSDKLKLEKRKYK